ncbi:hypothetical protein NDU88_008687 [Pleurodeles waltl]|uniref:Uncharacterized protein n=1 Tax=Pleurodeles waltl TaxID=8319 RepID=A0AAV7QSI6_PLEWA|nr:hypothetical protein NDU88_008687 [Pleurodeles waltl]
METDEETLQLEQAEKEDSLGHQEPVNHTCVETPESTAAREAFCDPSSHSSGEAWPSQVTGKEKDFDEYVLDIEHGFSAEALDEELSSSQIVVKNLLCDEMFSHMILDFLGVENGGKWIMY